MDFLLKSGVPVDLQLGQHRSTPLMVAAANSKVEAMQLLLDRNADPFLEDSGM